MFFYKPKEDKDNESMNVIIDLLNYRVWGSDDYGYGGK